MVFSSVTFLFLFLPLVLLLHFALPKGWRNGFLLIASLFFYAWGEPIFVGVMLLSVLANYLFGLWIAAARGTPSAKRAVTLATIVNLALLIAFKYANFLVDNLNVLLQFAGLPAIPLGPVHLPVGISFFTFQAMSYVIDVYRGHVGVQRNPAALGLYISLFPQLIAGPIVRYADVDREIARRSISLDDVADGVRIFLTGLGKKVLIANTLAPHADAIFAVPPDQLPCGVAWLGLFLYMMQLYYDFSGYSDMALGLGRMLGFHFLINFNYPFISHTVTENWQRWHISLSTWFRDYLFNPLGGYRCSRPRAYLNLMIVFVLCGIWHGSSWNFVVFGFYQGSFLIVERIIRARQLKFFKSWLGIVYADLVFATSLALFRTDTMPHALGYFRAILGLGTASETIYRADMFLNPEVMLVSVAAIVGSAPFIPWLNQRLSTRQDSAAWAWLRNGGCLAGLLFVLVMSCLQLASGTHNPFIYFRF